MDTISQGGIFTAGIEDCLCRQPQTGLRIAAQGWNNPGITPKNQKRDPESQLTLNQSRDSMRFNNPNGVVHYSPGLEQPWDYAEKPKNPTDLLISPKHPLVLS